jgi:hypothetical protein
LPFPGITLTTIDESSFRAEVTSGLPHLSAKERFENIIMKNTSR